MSTKIVLVVLLLGLIGFAATMSVRGVWGESSSVVSTRTGSPGGGYGLGGRGVK